MGERLLCTLALGRRDHVLLEQVDVLVVGGGVPVDEVGEALEDSVMAPLILEHVLDDVEALLGALAEVVHLEAAGGEDPAAVWEASLPERWW